MKKAVFYGPNYYPCNDFEAKELAYSFATNEEKELCTSSELVVHNLRMLINHGVIHHKDLLFVYRNYSGKEVACQHADAKGRLKQWPLGFCDHMEECIMQLLD